MITLHEERNTLDLPEIIQEFINLGYLSTERINPLEWRENIQDIIEKLNYLITSNSISNETCPIEVQLNIIPDNGTVENNGFFRKATLSIAGDDDDLKNNIEKIGSYYSFIVKMRLNAIRVLDGYLPGIGGRSLSRIEDVMKLDYSEFDDVIKIYRTIQGMAVNSNYSSLSQDSIKNFDFSDLENLIKEIKSSKKIKLRIDSTLLVKSLLSKIELLDARGIKIDFVDKIDKRKKNKEKLKNIFLSWGIGCFVLIIVIDTIFAFSFLYAGNPMSIDEFITHFLGFGGVFLTCIEIIIITLSLYLLKISNTYLQIIEIYDANISLIESDDFYKADSQLLGYGEKNMIFNLRKENTQKIHALPDRIDSVFISNQKQLNIGLYDTIISNLKDLSNSTPSK